MMGCPFGDVASAAASVAQFISNMLHEINPVLQTNRALLPSDFTFFLLLLQGAPLLTEQTILHGVTAPPVDKTYFMWKFRFVAVD